jgi:hypothetical protein
LQGPFSLVDAVFVKVIDAVKPIVTTEDVDEALVQYSGVSVSCRWRRIVDRKNLCPLIVIEVEFEEVVSAVCAVIAAKDVKIAVNCYGGVERPGAGWVVFIILLVLYQVPRTGVL